MIYPVRTRKKGQQSRRKPNGGYDRAEEPGGRHKPSSPSDDCDNSPDGVTNEPARETGSLHKQHKCCRLTIREREMYLLM
ncbi:hypothetical protein T01_11451 [Trichinella spiralis]|uniref:Uncharacterized protein n=1 Tax=Trichinella spiralis TaxID=6334 RepID=A0A0V1C0J4_TRISP|nr:hypothetical protein T01_11451 [Trichinella spiralis]